MLLDWLVFGSAGRPTSLAGVASLVRVVRLGVKV